MKLGGGAWGEKTTGEWLKTGAIISQRRKVLRIKPKNGHPRDRAYRFFGGNQLIRFYYFLPPLIVFSEPVHLIYYVWPSVVLSEPGSSDLLCFTAQSFLSKSLRLVYYVLPLSHF